MDRATGQESNRQQEIRPDNPSEKVTQDKTTPIQSDESADALQASNRQLKRKIFDFYTILELSRSFNAVLDLNSLLDIFLGSLLSQVNAAKAAIFQKEETKDNSFSLTSSRGCETFADKIQRLDSDSPSISILADSSQPVPIEELARKSNDEDELKIFRQFNSGLVLPLVNRSRLNGLLFVGNKQDGEAFGHEDIEFLAILASQIAVALENARLYEAEKRAIADLQATQQQLVHTERLAALGEMSTKIAHEINNPLGIIKNYLMLIGKSQREPAVSSKYVEIVGQEIDRIAGIVRELLNFHRPKNIEFKAINVLNVLEDIVIFLGPQLEGQAIQLSRKFSPDCPLVEASAENLKQVFINVILNASDAMPEGGSLEISAQVQDGNLQLRFCDTGNGVPEELIQEIFDPFFTTKQHGKGTGLGLSVCFGIIKEHKGTITYKNERRGGCIEITLPPAEVSSDE